MHQLQISNKLTLPPDAVTQTIVVYGAKGMGKTNFGSVFAEELYAAHMRFSVIDPMGVWWGLQHGRAKGESGLGVLLLGGIHGDLPITPTAAEVVADLVADENVSVVIDISRHSTGKAWTKGEKVRFVTNYMTRLYERQVEHRRPMMQIIDEAARYAPQSLRHGDVDEAASLGAIAMVCEEGRNLGIGLTLLTQRSARLNKDVAELADALIAFRIVGPNSVAAVVDWFGDHVPKERHKALVEQLRKLPIGTALMVSPGWLEFEDSVMIRERRTYDSSRTPKIGQHLEAPGRAQKPDLAKYRARMDEVVEQAQKNDPKVLAKQLAVAEREITRLQSAKPAPVEGPQKIKRVEVAVVKAAQINKVEGLISTLAQLESRLAARINALRTMHEYTDSTVSKIEGLTGDVRSNIDILSEALRLATQEPVPVVHPMPPQPPMARRDASPPPTPRRAVRAGEDGEGQIKAGAFRMLIVLHRYEDYRHGMVREELSTLAHVAKGGTLSQYVRSIIAAGYATEDEDGKVYLTAEGREQVPAEEPKVPYSAEEIVAMYLPNLKAGAQRMVRLLLEAYPHGYSRNELSDKADVAKGGTLSQYIRSIIRPGLVKERGNLAYAADILFVSRKQASAAAAR